MSLLSDSSVIPTLRWWQRRLLTSSQLTYLHKKILVPKKKHSNKQTKTREMKNKNQINHCGLCWIIWLIHCLWCCPESPLFSPLPSFPLFSFHLLSSHFPSLFLPVFKCKHTYTYTYSQGLVEIHYVAHDNLKYNTHALAFQIVGFHLYYTIFIYL